MRIGHFAIAAALLLTGCTTIGQSGPQGSETAAFDWFAYEGSHPADRAEQAGPDDYRNPILGGYYPDPGITRVGDDYYLVNSTFTHFPGIPIFHSRDLVNWTQIANAIDRPTQLDFGTLGLSRGVFAPTIEHNKGTYYIANTCVDCGGNFVITARDPKGPWSDPYWLPDLEGAIDPSLYFDEDGSAWILNNGPPEGPPQYDGHRAIWIQQFDPATNKTFGPRTMLVNGGVDFSKKPIWIEGPNLFRRDGYYYLNAAEGGTAEGHSQTIFRSRNIRGPYVPGPTNPTLTQRDLPADRPLPITSTGHADFVETQNGEWWASFLGVRPYRAKGESDHFNTGRETFLLPVSWQDGWPRVLEPGLPVPHVHRRPNLPRQSAPPIPTSGAFSIREEFDGDALPLNWLMLRNPRETWYRHAGGALHLTPRSVKLGEKANPSFLGRRQQHVDASASTKLRFAPQPGEEAGMAAFQSEDYWYAIAVANDGGRPMVRVKRRAGPNEDPAGVVIASAPVTLRAGAPIYFNIVARGGSYDFLYATREGRWTPLLRDADGTVLSTKVAGGFVGALFGLYAYRETPRP